LSFSLHVLWETMHCCLIDKLRLKCDGIRAETRFRLSAKRTSPLKSAGASVQSTTGSRGVPISGSNAGYTMFRGSVKSTGYLLHLPVSPSLSLPCVTVSHHISTAVYLPAFRRNLRYECGGDFGFMGFVLCLQMCVVSTGMCVVSTDVCCVHKCVLCLHMRVVSTNACCVYRYVLCLQMCAVSTNVCCVGACCVYRCVLCLRIRVVSTDVCCVY